MATIAPQDVLQAFADALEAGDLERILALYEPDAAFAPAPGETVSGTAAIRRALEPFVAGSPRMTGEIERVLVAGDTALVANRWSMARTGRDGEPVEMAGTSADVLRRQPDGNWRIAIDYPWGASA